MLAGNVCPGAVPGGVEYMSLSPWLGSLVGFSSFLVPCLQGAKHGGYRAEVGKGPCEGIEVYRMFSAFLFHPSLVEELLSPF